MTSPINHQKRIAPFDENSSKRLKDEAPLHPFISLLGLTKDLFPLSLSIQTIGTLSQVSQEVRQIALCFFLPKAQSLGLPVENAVTAKFCLKKLSSCLKTIQFTVFPSLAAEEKIGILTHSNNVSLFRCLCDWKIYSVPNNPLLEIVESPIFPKKAPLSQDAYLKGYQALTYAAYAGRRDLVNRLLELGAPTECPVYITHPTKMKTFLPKPLHLAVLSGDLEMVKSILERDPDMNVNYPPGYFGDISLPHLSLLECAIGGSNAQKYHERASLHLPMVQFILEKGVRPHFRDLIAAAEVASKEAMDLLLEDGGEFTTAVATKAIEYLVSFSSANDSAKAMFQFLLEQGADLDAGMIFCDHPLQMAILKEDLEWVRLLVAHIKNKHTLEVRKNNAQRPLHQACLKGNLPIIQCLVEAGADVDALYEEYEVPETLSHLLSPA